MNGRWDVSAEEEEEEEESKDEDTNDVEGDESEDGKNAGDDAGGGDGDKTEVDDGGSTIDGGVITQEVAPIRTKCGFVSAP